MKDELSVKEIYPQALDKFREDAGLDEARSIMPIYKNDIDEAFSRALMRRLGVTHCDD